MTARQVALFALRWDVRYWWGQWKLPGADYDAIHAEIRKLRVRIDQLEALR